jgi:hypothetical protein
MKLKNWFKWLAYFAFFFSLLFLAFGLYKPEPAKEKKQYEMKNAIYLDKNNNVIENKINKSLINLCQKTRWKSLLITGNETEESKNLITNKQLFTMKSTQLETLGRHKGEASISLLEFGSENNPNLILKFCDDSQYTFSKEQIIDKNLRLVMNSKGAIKLIENQKDIIKVIHKYLFSISLK